MSDEEQEKPGQISLPLEWHMPENVSSRYADNFIVQGRKNDFVLSFFESFIPPFVGTPEETLAFLEKITSIHAECVGRIVVSPEMIPDIIKALQSTYDGYLAAKKE